MRHWITSFRLLMMAAIYGMRGDSEDAFGASATLPPQFPHRRVQTIDRQRIHAPAHDLAKKPRRGGGLPFVLGHRVEPDAGRIGGHEALHPHLPGFLVEMLDR